MRSKEKAFNDMKAAVEDAGGMLIGVDLDIPEKGRPGRCTDTLYLPGSNGGSIRCSANVTHLDGHVERVYCPHCTPLLDEVNVFKVATVECNRAQRRHLYLKSERLGISDKYPWSAAYKKGADSFDIKTPVEMGMLISLLEAPSHTYTDAASEFEKMLLLKLRRVECK